MVTALQPSVAVAIPVTLVRVSAGQSRVRLGGAAIVGGVMSRTVMVCRAEALLPQLSVAVQVRAMTLVPPQLLVTASLKRLEERRVATVAVAISVALVPV